VGAAPKQAIHLQGQLHRAFSIFMVDQRGRILLQQRNPRKYHSGGLWANSCCGHPRPGERTVTAARRRLNEELGVADPLSFGFFARYRADLDHGMKENESSMSISGACTRRPSPIRRDCQPRFASLAEIGRRIKREPKSFTYWMKHYIQNHHAEIARHIRAQR